MEWMILPFKRYAKFGGRSRRKEFWMYILFVILVTIALSIVDALLGLGGFAGTESGVPSGMTGLSGAAAVSGGVLAGIFSLATIVPSIAVQVRRLHDTNRSGWWILAPLIPYLIGAVLMLGGAMGGMATGDFNAASGGALLVGGIMMFVGFIAAVVLLVFMCLDGTRGSNRFGPDPKDPDSDLGKVFS